MFGDFKDLMEVKKVLRSLGKGSFVENYEVYKNYNREEIIRKLVAEGKAKKSSESRATNAKYIFNNGLEKEALERILFSKVTIEVKNKAKKLLDSAK